MFDLSDFYR